MNKAWEVGKGGTSGSVWSGRYGAGKKCPRVKNSVWLGGSQFLECRGLKGAPKSIEEGSDMVRFGCFDRSLWLLLCEGSWEVGERPAWWSRLCWEGFVLVPARHPAPPFLCTSQRPSLCTLATNSGCLSPGVRANGRPQVPGLGRNRASSQEGIGSFWAGAGMFGETEQSPELETTRLGLPGWRNQFMLFPGVAAASRGGAGSLRALNLAI